MWFFYCYKFFDWLIGGRAIFYWATRNNTTNSPKFALGLLWLRLFCGSAFSFIVYVRGGGVASCDRSYRDVDDVRGWLKIIIEAGGRCELSRLNRFLLKLHEEDVGGLIDGKKLILQISLCAGQIQKKWRQKPNFWGISWTLLMPECRCENLTRVLDKAESSGNCPWVNHLWDACLKYFFYIFKSVCSKVCARR